MSETKDNNFSVGDLISYEWSSYKVVKGQGIVIEIKINTNVSLIKVLKKGEDKVLWLDANYARIRMLSKAGVSQ